MTKELDGLSGCILSHWFLTRKSSHAGAGMEHGDDRAVKEAWEGQGLVE